MCILEMWVWHALQQTALMEASDCREVLQKILGVLRSASAIFGALSAMTTGLHLMFKLLADNWDSHI